MVKCSRCKKNIDVCLTIGKKKYCWDCLRIEAEGERLGIESDVLRKYRASKLSEVIEVKWVNEVKSVKRVKFVKSPGRKLVYKRFSNPDKRGLYRIKARK